MEIVLETLLVLGVLIIMNYFLHIRHKERYDKKNIPLELNYLVSMYNIDVKKINYSRFLWTYCLLNSVIITFIYLVVIYLVEGIIWKIIVGIILLILLIIIGYGLLGRYYERKMKQCEILKKSKKSGKNTGKK